MAMAGDSTRARWARNYGGRVLRGNPLLLFFVVYRSVFEPGTVFNGVTYNMTSGWLDTQHKVNQTKGRFEASIMMPNPNATGAWPAWWLLPEGECWPVSGEVDIVEWYALNGNYQHSRPENPVVAQSTYHFGYSCGTVRQRPV